MIKVQGKYNNAVIYSDRYDEEAYKQILEVCNYKPFEKANIKVMPDYHAGKGCVIGFTSCSTPVVIPNLIGVDIGCGVLAVKLPVHIDVKELDRVIRATIPSGFEVNKELQSFYQLMTPLSRLHCYNNLVDTDRLEKSLGSLGGGNHFIELDVDSENNQWLVIHSGSRNLGKQVAEFYQDLAKKYDFKQELDTLIKNTPKQERESAIKTFKEKHKMSTGLEYLNETDMCYYLNDLKICQEFAHYNRYQIATNILCRLGMTLSCKLIESVHNYYDDLDGVIRKGAISARKGEWCVIPMNMRDGTLLCKGKGNKEWNYSAPHGAGRLMSRAKAKETLNMQDYLNSMQNIYTTSVNESTLDEAPMAYKPMQEIVEQIGDTVEIIDVLKPIYNFKA